MRLPLDTLGGLIKEAGCIYRQMKVSKIDHDKGAKLVWVLGQMRAMLEAQQLEQMNARLEELAQLAESRNGAVGSSGREQLRLPN